MTSGLSIVTLTPKSTIMTLVEEKYGDQTKRIKLDYFGADRPIWRILVGGGSDTEACSIATQVVQDVSLYHSNSRKYKMFRLFPDVDRKQRGRTCNLAAHR